jgi:DNA-binding LytR/AlgR family response regulator
MNINDFNAFLILQMFAQFGNVNIHTSGIVSEIYYIESVDKRTYIYLENGVGECVLRLYELEEMLSTAYFLRISKSCIVNIAYVKSITLMINRNLLLTMRNGEKVIVSRRYVKKINEMIGME